MYILSAGVPVALGDIDVPLDVVRELIATISSVCARFGRSQAEVWAHEASLAHLEGDDDVLRNRVEKLVPLIGWEAQANGELSCPGCMLQGFVGYLGPDPDPGDIEALVRPMLRGEPFPRDAARGYTETDECHTFELAAHLALATAYAKHGRLAEARAEAAHVQRLTEPSSPGDWLNAQHLLLEIAIAARDTSEIARLIGVVRPLVAATDSPYAILAEHIAIHAGLAILGEVDQLAPARAAALAVAARWDARLDRKRHVARTERALAGHKS
jgi:hypothetical protein